MQKALQSFFILVGIVGCAFILIIFILRYIGEKTTHPDPQHRFKRGQFEIIAHRGGGLERPENTLMAFDYAINLYPDIILEMDIHLTKDQHLVVIHDDTVDRTTNGTGTIHDLTLEEIQQLDAGYYFTDNEGNFPYRGQGLTVPTLKEVLLKYPQQRKIIEIKTESQAIAQALIDLLKEIDGLEQNMIASQFHQVIKHIRNQYPDGIFAGTKTQVYQSIILLNMFLEPLDPIKADVYSIPEVHNNIPLLSERLLKEMHRRGKPVFIWTINKEEDMKRLISYGVDGIVTDRPSKLLELIPDQNIPNVKGQL